MPKSFKRSFLPFAVAPLVFFGLLVRFAGAGGELWLDEIFSLRLAESFASPAAIFRNFSDNNHYLNSLYLFAIGSGAEPLVYRALSLVFSILALALAVGMHFQKGREEGFIAAVLFSLSYVLVLYGTEARGYSAMLFFSLLSFALAKRYSQQPSAVTAGLFFLSSLGGLLSHFTFLHCYVALLGWHVIQLVRRKLSFLDAWMLHLGPLFVAALLVVTRVSKLEVAGGPQGSRLEVLVNAIVVPYGGFELSAFAVEQSLAMLVLAILIGGALVAELIAQVREGRDDAWFFVLIVFLAPVCLLLVFSPEVFVLRYVLVSICFGYFVAVSALARLHRRGAAATLLSAGLVSLYIVGNGLMLQELAYFGRGQYREALEFIARHSEENVIAVGGDQDFRNGLLVSFYGDTLSSGQRTRYANGQVPNAPEVEWLLFETQDQRQSAAEIEQTEGLAYLATFESAPLSGTRWFVFCKQCPPVIVER